MKNLKNIIIISVCISFFSHQVVFAFPQIDDKKCDCLITQNYGHSGDSKSGFSSILLYLYGEFNSSKRQNFDFKTSTRQAISIKGWKYYYFNNKIENEANSTKNRNNRMVLPPGKLLKLVHFLRI